MASPPVRRRARELAGGGVGGGRGDGGWRRIQRRRGLPVIRRTHAWGKSGRRSLTSRPLHPERHTRVPDKLQNTARRMPPPYEFDPQHADGIRYVDLIEGERVLNEVIYECQRSLEEIGHAKLDLEARSQASGMGLRE